MSIHFKIEDKGAIHNSVILIRAFVNGWHFTAILKNEIKVMYKRKLFTLSVVCITLHLFEPNY